MAKMMNPNTVSDMTLVNAKSQARAGQIMQKVGKGKRKVEVTLSKGVRNYLNLYIKERTKSMGQYRKQIPNLFQFYDYMERETRITKGNKKEKQKKLALSYEEMDYLKMELKELVKQVDQVRKNLKWYKFLDKLRYSFSKKQSELALEELSNNGKNKGKSIDKKKEDEKKERKKDGKKKK